MMERSVPVDAALEVTAPHTPAGTCETDARNHPSAKEAQIYVHGLLHRYEIPFKKVIFVRPIRVLAHELGESSRIPYCKIEQSSNGECYVIISEDILKEECEGFLSGFGTSAEWKSAIAFNLLIEIARYKYLQFSQNRCEQWALNEFCSGRFD